MIPHRVDESSTAPNTREALLSRLAAERWNALVFLRDYSIFVTFAGLFIALSVSTPAFLSKTNILNILDQNAPIGLAACGATVVIISGGFDLSCGAIFAVAGVIAAWVAIHVGAEVGLLAGVGAGIVAGALNGFLVSGFRINSFLATLASSLALRATAVAISGGFLLSVSADGFNVLGTGRLLGVTYGVWVLAIAVVLTAALLGGTRLGRYIYAVGGNAEAARLSGVRVSWVRFAAFVFSGLTAGIAGTMAASRIATGQADVGVGLELTAIAATVLGGTSIRGGSGGVFRTLVGVLVLAMIGNGFNILGLAPFYRDMATGAIIIVALALNNVGRFRD